MALLAAQASDGQPGAAARVLLCSEDQTSVNLIELDATGRPSSWSLVPAYLADLKLQLDVITARLGSMPVIDAMDIDASVLSDLTEATGAPVNRLDESTRSAAMRAAKDVLTTGRRPWIEFRRGPLAVRDRLRQHRKPLDALLAAAAVFMLAVAAVFVVRAARYAHQEQSFDQQMTDAFRGQFPDWSIPANIKAVIDSEHRKSSAAAGGAAPADARASALQSMHAVLSRLPNDGRFAIDRMTFEDASFELTGRLRSYEQVDALASAGRGGGFEVPPPQTRRQDDGSWAFTLRGTRANKPSSAIAKGGAD
jgi:hypothetical protein